MFGKQRQTERKLVAHYEPKSQIAEQYRNIRTNIQFTAVDSDVRSIVVTSSCTGEGKTTTIANLAVVFGQQGKQVLVIDADMRKSKLHEMFHIHNQFGLTNVLSGQASFEQCVHKTEIENVSFLPSGPIPPNPAELLSFRMMGEMLEQAYAAFDIVLIDTPPVLAVTDAQIVANRCDGIILVVRSEVTEKAQIVKTKQLLDNASGKLLGVVLNDKKQQTDQYGYY
ncbi:tyrosine protein kinase [Bacillus sp. AFS018417]|uniref:CpsD/CapB family tyrosine-protein kinase n=1 Tax=Bacillus sp. AFS018417 TaxID=2033491 RepID=UPI000BFA2621|nr:CpsD/CapB family tyrosine-protein kinase [Bacillus sp. AFS018417]PEZ03478.1 tyrosine protein kinase [Bacillus sp. AFS018417]